MISHSLNLINEFMRITKYYQDNDFSESDFTSSIDDKQILEAQKEIIVTYKELTFSTRFFISINALTDELYCIAFFSNEVNQDNHIIITEYLTQMISLFIDFVSNDMFLTINENEMIIDFYQSYLEKRKEGYYRLNSIITNVCQGHILMSHQFYNQIHYVFLYAITHSENTISLQLNFVVDDINPNIYMN